MNVHEALKQLILPGGWFDEGQQFGVNITFSGAGNLEELRQELAKSPWSAGTIITSRSDSFSLRTFAALQAPHVMRLLVKCGFSIDSARGNMIPAKKYMVVLMGHGPHPDPFLPWAPLHGSN